MIEMKSTPLTVADKYFPHFLGNCKYCSDIRVVSSYIENYTGETKQQFFE